APVVTRFDVPGVVAAGGLCQLIWETTGAVAVELHVDGAVIFRTTDLARAQAGFYSFPVGDADFGVEVVAFSAQGVTARRLATVGTVRPPAGATLSVTPGAVALGAPVTITWSAPEARRVRITDSLGDTVFSRTGAQAEGGEATLYPQ